MQHIEITNKSDKHTNLLVPSLSPPTTTCSMMVLRPFTMQDTNLDSSQVNCSLGRHPNLLPLKWDHSQDRVKTELKLLLDIPKKIQKHVYTIHVYCFEFKDLGNERAQ